MPRAASPERPEPSAAQLAAWLSPRRLGAGCTLLVLGIALRLLVFCFLAPINNDRGHAAVVAYIAEHHAIPSATANAESYQPPLYYLLAAPLYAATGSLKCAQSLSLVFSVLTLLVLYRLFYVEKLLPNETAARYAFALACFLPQFVLFSLYLSNDALAILLGALLVWQSVRVSAKPSAREAALLALLTSLGLLTKATFLTFLPVLFVLVGFVLVRSGNPAAKAWAAALVLCLLAAGLGSWRFVQSYREIGDPFASNIDPQDKWVIAQQRSYRGAASFLDVNLLNLVAAPSISPRTESAYPLLLYGTFWYQHIPESNFEVSRFPPYYYLGSAIYLLAVIPSAAFLVGLFELAKRIPRLAVELKQNVLGFNVAPRSSARHPSRRASHGDSVGPGDQHLLVAAAAVSFLFGNLTLILAVAAKSHVWSVMQSRLLFPSFAGMLLPFGEGVTPFAKSRSASALLAASMVALAVCFYLYYASEISAQLGGWPFV